MKQSRLITSFIAASLMVPVLAFAQPDKPSRPMRGCNVNVLNLTDAQKEQLEQLRQQRRNNFRTQESTRKEREAYRNQVNELIKQKNFDENKARDLVSRQLQQDSARMTQMQINWIKERHDFFHVLTKKQQEIWLKECNTGRNLPMRPTSFKRR